MNTDSFWVSNPQGINFFKLWPQKGDKTDQVMNCITMVVVYLCILVAMVYRSFLPLYVGVLVVGLIAIVYYLIYNGGNDQYESYTGHTGYTGYQYPGSSNNVNQSDLRYPTINNPFMNVNPTDYDAPQKVKDYDRYKTVDIPTPESEQVRTDVNSDFINGLFQNPSGKIWQRQNSQREFISQPIGSVPNDQGEFASWLYSSPEGTCKAGSIWQRYGVKFTPDSLLCNGINVSPLTNMGKKSMNGN